MNIIPVVAAPDSPILDTDNLDLVKCPGCDGDGKIVFPPLNINCSCRTCNGTGWVTLGEAGYFINRNYLFDRV